MPQVSDAPLPTRPPVETARSSVPGAVSGRSPKASLADLEARVAAQAVLIDELRSELSHTQKIFDRASNAAQIGMWECELPGCSLKWTDAVYDLFELPRGTSLDREIILDLYPEATRTELERIRSKAIDAGTGFVLDAEIDTALGRRRWIRITASVECVDGRPVRIFGMKQDITAEKNATLALRRMADCDSLTGLASRGRFQAQMAASPSETGEPSPVGAVMLIDLDRFKPVNDVFGHLVGDLCLQEVGRRLACLGPRSHCVARIGGDEFAALFGPQTPRAAIERLGQAVVRMLRRPMRVAGHRIDLGASVGIAFAGCSTGDALYGEADAALYAAKAAGRGLVRVFAEAKHSAPRRQLAEVSRHG